MTWERLRTILFCAALAGVVMLQFLHMSVLTGTPSTGPASHTAARLEVSSQEADAATPSAQSLRDPNKLNVHVVCFTHDDPGWLKTMDEYYYGMKQYLQRGGVQYTLASVVAALLENPERKYTYAEMSFFMKWWGEQNNGTRRLVKRLVAAGQLDFVNGGYVQHDEASAHYVSMIDQTTKGQRFLNDTFGKQVRVGWQIDPFGHSSTHAALFSYPIGTEGVIMGRADFQDMAFRGRNKAMDLVWRGAQSWGAAADLFVHNNFDGNYQPPAGIRFEGYENPIIDDPAHESYNLPRHVATFVKRAREYQQRTRGNDVMFLMGGDFTWSNAFTWFINLDRLIKGVNKDGRVNAFYSTPTEFIAAKRLFPGNVSWPLKTDDFFPYADNGRQYWTGYFTSRPTAKGFVRSATSYLQAARQLEVLSGRQADGALEALEHATCLAQHHDALTGTEKQPVANDYNRQLHVGMVKAEPFVSAALLELAFPRLAGSQATDAVATTARRSLAATTTATTTAATIRRRKTRSTTRKSEPRPPGLHLTQCELLNASICDVTVTATARGDDISVVVYNPLAWSRTHPVAVPVANTTRVWRVLDPAGQEVASQVVPAGAATLQFQSAVLKYTQGLQNHGEAAAPLSVVFQAEIPPLGVMTFYLKAAPSAAPHPEFADRNGPPGAKVVVSNGRLRLEYDAFSGRLVSARAEDSSWVLPLQHRLMYYRSHNSRASGAYVFLPASNDAEEVAAPSQPVKLRVLRGPVVQEVHQEWAPWAHLVTRLWADQDHIEHEWTVGPIPEDDGVGKEVISRFSTPLQTEGVLWTDSNGREMVKRVRDRRPAYDVRLDQMVAVTGNYYPVSSGAAVGDARLVLGVATDRGQGVASVRDGELEFMVHRNVLTDDDKGVGEALRETMCGCSHAGGYPPCLSPPCAGLIARGRHFVTIDPNATAAGPFRRLQAALNDPPVVGFAPLPCDPAGPGGAAGCAVGPQERAAAAAEKAGRRVRAVFSGVQGIGLPENVHLVTLMRLGENRLLVRLAHQFQSGEHPVLSKPAKVDLRQLLTGHHLAVRSVTELSLSASQTRAQMPRPHRWPVETTTLPMWPPGSQPQYDISSHDPSELPVVELFPMEIRTFEVTVAG